LFVTVYGLSLFMVWQIKHDNDDDDDDDDDDNDDDDDKL